MRNKLFAFVFLLITISSCSFFKKEKSKAALAKVNEHVLFEEELIKNLPVNISKEDSIAFARSFIKDWALDKIILDRAKFNLPIEEQVRYDKMVEEYRSQLYKKAYMNALAQKKVSAEIDSIEIIEYYSNNKNLFKINEHLLKLRYVYAKNELKDFSKIKESFKRFDFDDQIFLDVNKLKFDKAKLNDSVWVRSLSVFKDLKELSKNQKNRILYNNRYIEIEDNSGTYLIYVKDVLKPNSVAPINYIRPTIEQILRNKKEIKIKSDLEKQILNDAIINKDYEIFE